jgi:hypothetical protein
VSTYEVICVNTEYPHDHIIRVGTGEHDAALASGIWTVEQVRAALAQGDTFFVEDDDGDKVNVRIYDCPKDDCVIKTIRTTADDIKDDNLLSLRTCNS